MRTLLLLFIFYSSFSALAQTVDSLVVNDLRHEGVTFSRNNAVTLLSSGQAKFDDMFEAIRQARSSIHLEYFNFRNDSIATLLFDLLAMKAQQGVEIRALYDDFGNASNNQPLKKHHIKSLHRRGIEIHAFDPMRFPWVTYALSRDHRKIVVIDGLIAYTGGMNVADYYINGTEQVGEWHDMHCRIEGEEVNTLQDIFLRVWNKTTKQSVHGNKYFHGGEDTSAFYGLTPDTCETSGHKMVGIVNREPRRTNQIIRTFYTSAINHAHDSIKLINPYFTLNRTVKRALRHAASRGVKVEIMLSTRSDIPLSPDCGFYNAHKLMRQGCIVWLYEPGFHHTKIIMVDGKLCTVGSANLNSRSLRWDYEANAVIADECVTRQLDNLFERDKQKSFQLTEANWKTFRTPWQRFQGWFAHFLAPFL